MTRLSRREFLGRSGATLTGLAGLPHFMPASALAADGTVAPSERITVGLIGCGSQGGSHLQRFAVLPQFQVAAVCDVDSRRSEGKAKGDVAGYKDFRQLLDRSDLDAVHIVTPDHWHALMAVAAIQAGKDVYCEKPFAYSITEGRAVVDAVAASRQILQVGTQERSVGSRDKLGRLLREGLVGKLQQIEVGVPSGQRDIVPVREEPVPNGFDYDFWLGPAPEAPYQKERCHMNFRWILDYSQGELADRGAHVADIALWVAGDLCSGAVEVEGEGQFPETGLYNAAFKFDIRYQYASGVSMSIRSVGPRGVKFIGDRGWIFCPVQSPGNYRSEPANILEKFQPEPIPKNKMLPHFIHWADCIRSRQQPIAPAEGGHRTSTTLHLGQIAMQLGRKLRFDSQSERFLGDDEANSMLGRKMRTPWKI